MSGIPPLRLTATAKAIFTSLNKHRVRGIIFGGSAVNFHGGDRNTTDVDVNVSSLNFKDKLPTTFKVKYDTKRPTRLKASFDFQPGDAVPCDFGTERAYLFSSDFFDKYSILSPEGVRFATVNILLADKIRTFGQRKAQKDGKRDGDLIDITFLLGRMMEKQEMMSEDIKDIILTPESMDRFWKALDPSEVETYREFFTDVGILAPGTTSEARDRT